MPIHAVKKDGKTVGYQYGQHGKVYPTRAQAAKQAAAIHAAGYQEPKPKGK